MRRMWVRYAIIDQTTQCEQFFEMKNCFQPQKWALQDDSAALLLRLKIVSIIPDYSLIISKKVTRRDRDCARSKINSEFFCLPIPELCASSRNWHCWVSSRLWASSSWLLRRLTLGELQLLTWRLCPSDASLSSPFEHPAGAETEARNSLRRSVWD